MNKPGGRQICKTRDSDTGIYRATKAGTRISPHLKRTLVKPFKGVDSCYWQAFEAWIGINPDKILISED